MATLLPSFVVCVQGSDGRACVFKQADAAGFATDMAKEIIFNPDVDLSREPALYSVDPTAGRPWTSSEDLLGIYTPLPGQPSERKKIGQLVDALAINPVSVLPFVRLFEWVPGDVKVTDGSECPGL